MYPVFNVSTDYHCGSDQGWSAIYYFKTLPKSSNWSPSFAVFGDLGNINAQSLPRLQEEVQRGEYDAILHVGDFAYDMDSVRNFSSLYNIISVPYIFLDILLIRIIVESEMSL